MANGPDAGHAGHGREGCLDPPRHVVYRRLRPVALERDRDAKRQQVVGSIAEVGPLQGDHRADEQAGADEQHDAERNLHEDERLARASMGSPGHRPTIAGLEGSGEIGPQDFEHRAEREETCPEERGRAREENHGRVKAGGGQAIQARRPHGEEARLEPTRHGRRPATVPRADNSTASARQ